MPDAELVARIRAGDTAAFEAVYDRYHRPLLGFCRHMLGSQPEAEDALQHVFIAADCILRADVRPVQLKPWLYAVASNRCTSVLRARREHVALDAVREPSTAGLALADEVERREDLKHLLFDVAALPDAQRAALVLAELGDLTHEEIAATLDVRPEKVKALVFQARESLVGSRRARDTDCAEIREQLATLRGSALRRTSITRHVAVCPACAAFRADLRTQRAALGCVLPVVPALALKQHVLGVVLAGGSGTAATAGLVATGATGGAALGTGGAGVAATGATAGSAVGAAAGVGAASASTTAGGLGIATKAFVALALAGGAAGGGVAVEHHQRSTAPRVERVPARPAPAAVAVPAPDPAALGGLSPSARPGRATSPVKTGAQRKAAAARARAAAKSKRRAVAKQARERGRRARTAAGAGAAPKRPAQSELGPASKPTRAQRAKPGRVKAPKAKPAKPKVPPAAKPASPGPAAAKPQRTPKPGPARPAKTPGRSSAGTGPTGP